MRCEERALKRDSELAGGTLIRVRPRRFCVGEQGIIEASAPRLSPLSADEVPRMTALSSSPADFPGKAAVPRGRWAIDTRKPIAKGLDREYNSLDAQLDECSGGVPGEKNSGFHTLCA